MAFRSEQAPKGGDDDVYSSGLLIGVVHQNNFHNVRVVLFAALAAMCSLNGTLIRWSARSGWFRRPNWSH